jgi:hypothetical protein
MASMSLAVREGMGKDDAGASAGPGADIGEADDGSGIA